MADSLREDDTLPGMPAHRRHGPPPSDRDAPALAALRFVVCGEIARGGMGVVLRARDPQLGRELALKVLLADHQGDPAMVRRFQEEAQITGQLQHPGVPPVHELGRLPDGRPWFAMKLVQGRTLRDLLRERVTLADDLDRWLSVFEQVCQTVAYAHS